MRIRPVWLMALAALLLVLTLFSGTAFTVTMINYVGIYTLVALGLVLLTGVGGLTSFGQAAFVGLGAYATAWLSTADLPAWLAWTGGSPWAGLVLGFLVTFVGAWVLGAISLRLAGHFLPLGTIA